MRFPWDKLPQNTTEQNLTKDIKEGFGLGAKSISDLFNKHKQKKKKKKDAKSFQGSWILLLLLLILFWPLAIVYLVVKWNR